MPIFDVLIPNHSAILDYYFDFSISGETDEEQRHKDQDDEWDSQWNQGLFSNLDWSQILIILLHSEYLVIICWYEIIYQPSNFKQMYCEFSQ